MNRLFALLLCFPLIRWLWKRDQQARPELSRYLWIPLLWVFVLGSRPVSFWLGVGGSGGGDLEGNWFDRTLYLVQILLSLRILKARGVSWGKLIGNNKTVFFFYLFLLVSTLWSPYPFVAFKRWFKDAGALAVILVIVSEKYPLEAIKAVFARCAFVWFPLSEIFAKYFSQLGREYSRGGDVMYTGVTTQKNSLGEIILVAGLILVSELSQPNRPPGVGRFKGHHLTIGLTLGMGLWLLFLSNSKTSLICFLFGVIIVLGYKLPWLRTDPRRFLVLMLISVGAFFVAENIFHVSETFLSLAGRDATLTNRTEIWKAVKQNPVDPLLGTGYMMYWDRFKTVEIGDYDVTLNTAHNGYLEAYLDGGVVGVVCLVIMLVGVGYRVCREFLTGSELGRLALAFYLVGLLFNISESMFARRSPLWFAFLLLCLEFRGAVSTATVGNQKSARRTLRSPVHQPASV